MTSTGDDTPPAATTPGSGFDGRPGGGSDGGPGGGSHDSSDGGLDGSLAVLDSLGGRPLHEHAEIYQSLHRDLQSALAEIDSA